LARNEMAGDYQYYKIEKRLDEIQDLLSEILRRLGKIEYTGEVEYGEPYNVGRSKKHINISLRKVEENDS
tara:strand:- start:228 stop:437 length:210 start_codon:yes stop_codon:yes gene_type:complete